ncbi:MAG: hypothetical protein IPK60_22750 [Sandaracinaceae bacterium]|nr:hypothetical protein [Sandaracinaceae bacterium]
MTSELAKKVAARIAGTEWYPDGSDVSEATEDIIAHAFECGDFDDLLAPEGRPVLSDDTLSMLLSGAENNHEEFRMGHQLSLVEWYAKSAMDAFNGDDHEDAKRCATIHADLVALDAYLEKREAGR